MLFAFFWMYWSRLLKAWRMYSCEYCRWELNMLICTGGHNSAAMFHAQYTISFHHRIAGEQCVRRIPTAQPSCCVCATSCTKTIVNLHKICKFLKSFWCNNLPKNYYASLHLSKDSGIPNFWDMVRRSGARCTPCSNMPVNRSYRTWHTISIR